MNTCIACEAARRDGVFDETKNVSQRWRVNIRTHLQTSSSVFFQLVPCSRIHLLVVHFDPEMLPRKTGSRHVPRSLLQHCTSSGMDGGVQVSVHELDAFIASG